MTTAPLTLYGESLWISPYVFSTYVALREKGVPFDMVELQLPAGEHLEPPHRDRSLTARVPALGHGDFCLAESNVIAEYLEEIFPAPTYARLYPEDRRARARARQLMAWFRSDLGALRDERATVSMFYRYRPAPLSAAASRDVDKLVRVAASLIPADRGPLFGAWCLADSELAFMLHRLILTGDPLPDAVAGYARRQWTRPSVQAFVAHARPPAIPDSYWTLSGTPRPEDV